VVAAPKTGLADQPTASGLAQAELELAARTETVGKEYRGLRRCFGLGRFGCSGLSRGGGWCAAMSVSRSGGSGSSGVIPSRWLAEGLTLPSALLALWLPPPPPCPTASSSRHLTPSRELEPSHAPGVRHVAAVRPGRATADLMASSRRAGAPVYQPALRWAPAVLLRQGRARCLLRSWSRPSGSCRCGKWALFRPCLPLPLAHAARKVGTPQAPPPCVTRPVVTRRAQSAAELFLVSRRCSSPLLIRCCAALLCWCGAVRRPRAQREGCSGASVQRLPEKKGQRLGQLCSAQGRYCRRQLLSSVCSWPKMLLQQGLYWVFSRVASQLAPLARPGTRLRFVPDAFAQGSRTSIQKTRKT